MYHNLYYKYNRVNHLYLFDRQKQLGYGAKSVNWAKTFFDLKANCYVVCNDICATYLITNIMQIQVTLVEYIILQCK